jgi:HD-GYP domain-containing protein (c-di-GMP phosphodiesterase class II)
MQVAEFFSDLPQVIVWRIATVVREVRDRCTNGGVMGEMGATATGSRVVALLAGRPDLDEPVREALRRVDPEAAVFKDPDAALAWIAGGGVELVVFDHANTGTDPRDFRVAVGSCAEGTPPALLALLARGGEASVENGEDQGQEHFLARPFRPETLIALCLTLLDQSAEAASSKTVSDPSLQVRRPARFSARPLYADAVAYARKALEGAGRGEHPDMNQARMLAERLHTSLLQSNLLLIRALEPYKRFEIDTHCANVAIFAAKIALGLDFALDRTLQVIQAGLLHDIGMARLPDRILEKEGPLTDEEREEMQQHPVLGAEVVAELGPGFDWLQKAIRQEHERIRGGGYPDGLADDQIDDIAQILGVADVFEACSHARGYRSPFTAFEALEKVIAMRDEQFDRRIVDALANEISVFPLDSYVKLSTGSIGRVVATNPGNLMRPTVEVLWDAAWAPLAAPEVVVLEQAPEITVERPLHESEVPIT